MESSWCAWLNEAGIRAAQDSPERQSQERLYKGLCRGQPSDNHGIGFLLCLPSCLPAYFPQLLLPPRCFRCEWKGKWAPWQLRQRLHEDWPLIWFC